MTILSAQKVTLRKEMMAELQNMPREMFLNAGIMVRDCFAAWIGQTLTPLGMKFGCFVNFKDEIDTAPLNKYLQIAGQARFFPSVTSAMTLDFFDEQHLRAELSDLDVILMPGLAFGLDGSRLGRGKGCYDRSLGQLRQKPLLVALALDCQVKKSIPIESHDILMDYLCTPALGMLKTRKMR